MTPEELKAWQQTMGYTYDQAAKALGVSRSAYADWVAGVSRTTGQVKHAPLYVGLACAALAAGMGPWSTQKSE